MSREITSNMLDALEAGCVRPVYLTEIETASTPLYLASTNHNISWDSHTWLGNGMIKSELNGLSEAAGELPTLEVDLYAYDSSLLSILFDLEQRMTCNVYIGALNSSGTIIADPFLIFEGLFESVEIQDDGGSIEATIQYQNELGGFRRINELRWTHESQQVLFPGDTGFEYCAKLADKKIFWGTAPQVQRIRKRRVGRN